MRRAFYAFVVLVLGVSPAFGAARTVTVLGVSGPGGERFAAQIALDLSELYEMVPGRDYREAAQRLGHRGASPEEVRAVAAEVHVDAVIGGAIVGSGRDRRLLVAVRDGASGRLVARGRYDLSGQTLPIVRERVVRDLVRALERCGAHAGAMADESTPEPPPGQPGEATTAEQSDVTVVATAPRPEGPQGIYAGVGFSVLSRSLSFDVASAPGYGGGAVSGIRADGAVFPLALSAELASAHPVLASFGLVGSYEHVFTFNSTVQGAVSQGHASHWVALLVGRIPLGHNAYGGVLQIESGYQNLDYHHESVLDVRVPDVTYEMIDAGLGWDRALGTRRLVGALRAAFLGVLDAGNIYAQSQYGKGSGFGAEAEASLTAWPLRWLWLRLDARYDHVGIAFVQNGTRFAHSSSDDWIGGTLEVGFAL